jgi:hypothetical protein
MRDREMEHVVAANLDLDERVATWRRQHADGTLRDAVADLELWPTNPDDPDAQRMIWLALRRIGDPVATRLGFPAMRAASIVPAVGDAGPGAPAATAGAAPDCAAGTLETDGRTM